MPMLVEQALPRAYVAAFRILGNREAAQDACQEAARKALGAEQSYDQGRPFYPWFRRIVKNCCLDRYSRQKQERDRAVSESHLPASAEPSAEQVLLQDERAHAVSAGVRSLPDELREVLELRHFEDASYREIAEALNIPEGTVMSRLYRARKSLRASLIDNPAFSRPQMPARGPQ